MLLLSGNQQLWLKLFSSQYWSREQNPRVTETKGADDRFYGNQIDDGNRKILCPRWSPLE